MLDPTFQSIDGESESLKRRHDCDAESGGMQSRDNIPSSHASKWATNIHYDWMDGHNPLLKFAGLRVESWEGARTEQFTSGRRQK